MDRLNRARVFYCDVEAGELWRDADGFGFRYLSKYLDGSTDPEPIAFSLPLQREPFRSKVLFPFFQGLVAEGWLQTQQSITQRIDERDYFTLLVQNGRDLIGAVSVVPSDE